MRCIPESQFAVHVVTEALSLVLVGPFMFWLALNPALALGARQFAGVLAVATVVVDGGLLMANAAHMRQARVGADPFAQVPEPWIPIMPSITLGIGAELDPFLDLPTPYGYRTA